MVRYYTQNVPDVVDGIVGLGSSNPQSLAPESSDKQKEAGLNFWFVAMYEQASSSAPAGPHTLILFSDNDDRKGTVGE